MRSVWKNMLGCSQNIMIGSQDIVQVSWDCDKWTIHFHYASIPIEMTNQVSGAEGGDSCGREGQVKLRRRVAAWRFTVRPRKASDWSGAHRLIK